MRHKKALRRKTEGFCCLKISGEMGLETVGTRLIPRIRKKPGEIPLNGDFCAKAFSEASIRSLKESVRHGRKQVPSRAPIG
ncbi:MAG: hypothetical protein PHN60_04480 [Candidatus Gracilibacteria bacterium]|nr:hypothetical protein [Candidatus Gracilibacteria bacterium]